MNIKNLDKTDLITGAALTLAATAIFSVAKDTLRPLAVLGIRGAIGVVDGAKNTLQLAKEEIEDVIAEAQFERMKKQLDDEITLSSNSAQENNPASMGRGDD